MITKEYYESLLEYRLLRNKLVHELDRLILESIPNDLLDKIKRLIEIRKYASKRWFFEFEILTNPNLDTIIGEKGVIEDAISGNDMFFDILYDKLFD